MIDYPSIFFIFLSSLVICLSITPLVKYTVKKIGILDMPNARKIHKKPVPRLGGIGIFLSFSISILAVLFLIKSIEIDFYRQSNWILLGGFLIFLLGLWDDIKNIRPIVKLTCQVIIAIILFYAGFRVELLTNPFGGVIRIPLFVSMLISILWIVGIVNAMNLIDGLDGLACGIAFIAGIAILSVGLYMKNLGTIVIIAALAGSCLGFLKYNFYPAKIFMGDSGSMFLGMVLALAPLMGNQFKIEATVALLIPLAALTIPVSDIVLAFFRRFIKRGSVFIADKKHLHHRLLELGLSQKQAVLFLYLAAIYFGIIAFLFVLIPNEYAVVLLLLLGMGLYIGIRTIGFIERKLRSKYYK